MVNYDLVLGIGVACSCSQTIRQAELQFLSFPFDWLTPLDHHVDLRRRAAYLCDGFPGWLKKDDFKRLGDVSNTGMARCLNEPLNFYFLHDFPADKTLDEAFDDVNTKYARRISRLLGLLRTSRRVLLVRVDLPGLDSSSSLDDCRFVRARLSDRFPNAAFDFVLFRPDTSVTFESRLIETIEPGFTRISFDYQDHQEGALPHQVDARQTGEALKALGTVRDYRTRNERNRKRQERYRRFGVETALQYRLLRLRTSIGGRLLPAFNLLRRKKIAHILPLGINCEIAFYLNDVFGFVESSLFAWASSRHLDRMIHVLGDLRQVMAGEKTFNEKSYMWKCENTGLFFHGHLQKRPDRATPSPEALAADLADVCGRVAHLKEKFLRYATDDQSTLFIHRISRYDVDTPGLGDRLDALEAAIERLGARNWQLLVVCEKKDRRRIPSGPHRLVRTVSRFNPTSCVPDRDKGDPVGWHAIFSEFVPQKILPKAHAFKFE